MSKRVWVLLATLFGVTSSQLGGLQTSDLQEANKISSQIFNHLHKSCPESNAIYCDMHIQKIIDAKEQLVNGRMLHIEAITNKGNIHMKVFSKFSTPKEFIIHKLALNNQDLIPTELYVGHVA